MTGTLIRDGVPSIMNPDDKGGLEMALRLKDQYGAHVTVITMGPPQADQILREAFAMGVDRAILLTDRKFAGADTLATSNALAGAYVCGLEVEKGGKALRVTRETEDGVQILEAQMPCLLTVLSSAVKPRYMSAPGIVEAYNKNVEIWSADKIDVDESKLGLKGSPTKVLKAFTKGLKAPGEVFEVDPEEAVGIIVSRLKEKFII